MTHCQSCEVFGNKSGSHKAELKIVEYFKESPYRIELRVCRCCWYAIAFHQPSDRRRFQCPTSTETHFIVRIKDPSLAGTVYMDALERSWRSTLMYRLTGRELYE
jgi:hypothetical protein